MALKAGCVHCLAIDNCATIILTNSRGGDEVANEMQWRDSDEQNVGQETRNMNIEHKQLPVNSHSCSTTNSRSEKMRSSNTLSTFGTLTNA